MKRFIKYLIIVVCGILTTSLIVGFGAWIISNQTTFKPTYDPFTYIEHELNGKSTGYNGKAQCPQSDALSNINEDAAFKIYYRLDTEEEYSKEPGLPINAGTYIIKIALARNEKEYVEITFTINPAVVNKPKKDDTIYVYNGKEQQYKIETNDLYSVSNDIRVNAGTQEVIVSLIDKNNYQWDDNTVDDLVYEFNIFKAVPKIKDMIKVVYNQTGKNGYFTTSMITNNIEYSGSYETSGTFKYTGKEKLEVGTYEYEYTFIPDDLDNYEITSGTVEIICYATVNYYNGDVLVHTDDVEYNTTTTPYNISQEGYRFAGWYIDKTLENGFNFENPITADINFYVRWDINSYEVKFDNNGHGLAVPSQYVKYQDVAICPEKLTEVGYTFVGWYKESACINEYDFNTPVTSDITLYARWDINKYNVRFDNNGHGITPATQIVEYLSLASIPTPLEEVGYTFIGWYKESTCENEYDFNTPVTSDIILYARWEINKYTLEFYSDDVLFLSITQDFGSLIEKFEDPIKNGYKFLGWDKEVPTNMPANNMRFDAVWDIITYTITYHLNGGIINVEYVTTYTIETEDIILPIPTCTGYTFDGWYMDELFTGSKYDSILKGNTGDKEFYAKWNIITYTVNFDNNGHGRTPEAQYIEYLNKVKEPENMVTVGYTFIGWYKEKACINAYDFDTLVTEDFTLYAKWEINKYTVHFENNGRGEKVEDQIIEYNKRVDKPKDLVSSGFTFGGWFIDEACQNEYNFDMPVTNNFTLYAKWTIRQYTLTFISNGEIFTTITQNYNTRIIAPENPTRKGYTFKGWDQAIPARMPDKDMTFTAQWDIIIYDITYETYDGTLSGNDVKKYTVETETFKLNDPTKYGYTFLGWYDNENFSGDVVTEVIKGTTGNLTFYAKWTINKYTVMFIMNGHGETPRTQVVEHGSFATRPNTPTEVGYTFDNWYADQGLTKLYDFNSPVIENIMIYAKWHVNTYEIKFDTRGITPLPGTVPTPQIVEYGSRVQTPVEPENEEWAFSGWYTDEECTQVYDFNTLVTHGFTLYAKWKMHAYTVTFNANGHGVAPSSQAVTRGETVEIPVEPIEAGYTFLGWYTESSCINKYDFSTPVYNKFTLYAKWQINTYTITFDANGGKFSGNSTIWRKTGLFNEEFEAPENPTRVGYTFIGWDKEIPSRIPAENAVFKAQWQVNQYTISFNTVGGTTIESITLDYDAIIIPPSNPFKAGYNFVGWNPVIPARMPAYDMICTAIWSPITYKITYNLINDGKLNHVAVNNSNNPETYTIENATIVLSNPTRVGYTFMGWFSDSGLTNSCGTIEAGSIGDKVFYAAWKINQYKLIFDANGGKFIDNSDRIELLEDYDTQIIKPENPTRYGYTFMGWSPSVPTTFPADNVTYYAVWQIDSYTINYVLYGGVNNKNNPLTYTVLDEVIFKEPTKAGYAFGGWYLDEDGNNEITGISKGTVGNITIYAKWNANMYTVKYDGNGALSGSVEDSIHTFDIAKALNANNFVRPGYLFLGWSTSKTATNKTYSDMEVVSNLSTTPNDVVTLYAVWQIITYKITYYLSGGKNNSANPSVYNVNTETIVLKDPSKTGYTFKGWYLDETYTNSITEIIKGSTGDISVYAKWEINAYTYTFDANGGKFEDGLAIKEITDNFGTIINLPTNPTRLGYEFMGWSPSVPTTIVDKNITFKAIWKIITYKINYVLDGGTNSASNPQSYNVNTNVIFEAPTKLGYTFKGWFKDSGFEEQIFEIPLGSVGEVTVYAKWEIIVYTITYYLDGGTNSIQNVTSYTVEDTIILYEATKLGYTFMGWFKDSIYSGGSITIIEKGTTGNKEFYAKWSLNHYNINYYLDGGTNNASNPKDYTIISPTIIFNDPVKLGYTFMGWYKEATFNTRIYEIESGSVGEVNLYAKWEANKYTIKYNGNSETSGYVEDSLHTYDIEKALNKNYFTKTGYTFKGWSQEKSATTPTYKDMESVINLASENDSVVNLYAVWEIITYNITYHLDGGTNNQSNPSQYNVTTSTIVLKDPTKTGYTFLGWYTDESYNNQKTTIVTGSTGHIDLYARWEANKYTIKYDANGGTGYISDSLHTYDIKKALSKNYFERTGYTFLGWSKDKNAKTPTYKDLEEVINLSSTNNDVITLYAVWEIITYNITYHLDGGTNNQSNPSHYNVTTATIVLKDPTKTGYTFIGWYTDETFNNKITQITNGSAGHIDLYAKWEANKYTIKYDANGGTGYISDSLHTYNQEEALNKNTFVRNGYAFLGWSKDKNAKTATYLDEAKVINLTSSNGDVITLYAVWEIITYNITYHLDGGTNNPSNPARYVVSNSAIILNNPTKLGYTFLGWFTDETFNHQKTAIEAGSTGNIDLYAKWVANTYTIRYDANGGTGYISDSLHTYDQTKTLNKNTFIRNGYTFLGWSKDKNAKTATYKDMENVSNLATENGSVVTLYAVWSANTYYITYHLDGADTNNNPSSYVVGSGTIILKNPTKTGYTFLGWYTDETFNNKITQITNGTYGNIDLYARWVANKYTIKYDANGGTGYISDSLHTYDIKKALSKNYFERTGYTFLGWSKDKNAKTPTYKDLEEVINLSSTNNDVITLYAVWEIITYNITYHLDGGTNNQSNPSHYNVTTATIVLKDPTKTGYTFIGWYTDETFNNKITQITNGSTGHINLYASWVANKYTIKYDANGGTGYISDSLHTYNQEKALNKNTFVRTGYTFLGWSKDKNAKTATYTDMQSIYNLTSEPNKTFVFYAVWSANTYTIKYDANGGTGYISDSLHTYDVLKSLNKNNFVRTGYTFLGWSKDKSDKTATYKDMENVSNLATENGSVVTLYAVWSANTYTIKYDGNGATSGQMENSTHVYDILKNLNKNRYEKIGYTFLGWTKTKGSKQVDYTDETGVINLATENGSVVTLYAVWSANTYTIKYDGNGSTSGQMENSHLTYDVTFRLTKNSYLRKGYTFLGWSKDKNATTPTYLDETVIVNLSTTPNDVVVLYAVWSINTYTINYYLNDEQDSAHPADKVTNPLTYTVEDYYVLNNPTRKYYIFLGWYTEKVGGTKVTELNNSVGNMNLYAHWQEEVFIVTAYDESGGSLGTFNSRYGEIDLSVKYNYNSYRYNVTWVNADGSSINATYDNITKKLSNITSNMTIKAIRTDRYFNVNIIYKDKDNMATLAKFDFVNKIAGISLDHIKWGDKIAGLSRQIVIRSGNLNVFYMTTFDEINWNYITPLYDNSNRKDINDNMIFHVDNDKDELTIIVLCVQPSAIVSDSAIVETDNFNYKEAIFFETVDEAFTYCAGQTKNLYLRLFGTANYDSKTILAGDCITNQTTINAYNFNSGTYNFTTSSYKIDLKNNTLTKNINMPANVKIILPYNRSDVENDGYINLLNTKKTAYSAVHSILKIASGVTLTINGNLTVGGEIVDSNSYVESHGFLMNDGKIIINSTATLNAWGFVGGAGSIETVSGALITDVLCIYDWPGGSVALARRNINIFPFESYSFHNISCKTTIVYGAKFDAWTQIYAAGAWIQKSFLCFIGTGGLFELTSPTAYVVHSAEDTYNTLNQTTGAISLVDSGMNSSFTSRHQDTTQREVLDIYGDFKDNYISIEIQGYGIKTSTLMAMPIGFMRINVKSGNGILKENSYKFLPGSSLTVEEGASLTFDDNTNVIFYSDYADNYNYLKDDITSLSGVDNELSYIYNHKMWYAYYNYCVKYNTSTKAFENIAKQTPSVSFGAECIVKGTLVSKGSLVGNIYKYSTGKINTLKTTLDVMNVTEIDMVLIVIKYYYVTVELNIINK